MSRRADEKITRSSYNYCLDQGFVYRHKDMRLVFNSVIISSPDSESRIEYGVSRITRYSFQLVLKSLQ